jgi:hypothetical protein
LASTTCSSTAGGRLPRRRRKTSVPEAGEEPKKKQNGDGWAQRALREPRLGFAFAIGALVGLPGAAYIAALHGLIAGKYSTATQIAAVMIFAIVEFLLIIIPWAFLEIALLLGAYLSISALTRLL